MGGHGFFAAEELARREREERLSWLAQEELSRAIGDPFPSFHQTTQPIPRRFIEAASHSHTRSGRNKRAPEREVGFEGGAVPPLGEMGEEEYAEWVRAGMYRLKHRAELEERERKGREKEEKEKEREKVRERVRKEEKKRIERLKAEKSVVEEDRRRKEREIYRTRWKGIGEVDGEVEATELRYVDIPWPVYPGAELEKEGIKVFLSALARDDGDEGGGADGFKKVLREAIRSLHPDRFFGRVLGRVSQGEKEKVKEGVESCCRIIYDLAAENRG